MDPENRNTMDPVAKLPDEMLLHIFSHLDMEDLVPCCYVCRRWERLIKDTHSLWRQKEFLCINSTRARQVRAITSVMPRLKMVRLVIGQRSQIHIAWPKATVVLVYSIAEVPQFLFYQCILPTDLFLVSRLVANNVQDILNWVDPQTLRAIYVGEQCIAFIEDKTNSIRSFMDRSFCDIPECILHRHTPSLYKIPLSPRKFLPMPGRYECPRLEQLSIRCAHLFKGSFKNLTRLGPIRVLQVMLHDMKSLSFLDSCPKDLEILRVTKAPKLPSDPFRNVIEFFHECMY